jgi:hypothetical protein
MSVELKTLNLVMVTLCIVYRASKRVLQSGQELTKPIQPTPLDAENTPPELSGL